MNSFVIAGTGMSIGKTMKKLLRCLPLLLLLTSFASASRVERDETGRTVTIPDHVHRAVSLSPSLTNTVYALGAASDLVGITDYTIFPAEAAKQKPSVGAVVNPSLEHIVALHPDVVLALPEFNGAEAIEGLRRLGIPVFLFNTANIANIYHSIDTVGRVMGREREATALDCPVARPRSEGPRSIGRQRQAKRTAGSVD